LFSILKCFSISQYLLLNALSEPFFDLCEVIVVVLMLSFQDLNLVLS
jgi:hypothetical protein